MSNILKRNFIGQTLSSKLNQLRIYGIRHKKTCSPTQTPPCGCAPPPDKDGKCPSPCEQNECLPPTCSSLPACKVKTVVKKCDDPMLNHATVDDLPLPCSWFPGQAILNNAIYNRYLLAGLFMMTYSIYQFRRDDFMVSYMKNYRYMDDFDYDIDYKNLTSTVELSLVDVQNTHDRLLLD